MNLTASTRLTSLVSHLIRSLEFLIDSCFHNTAKHFPQYPSTECKFASIKINSIFIKLAAEHDLSAHDFIFSAVACLLSA
jgi:hypothetical protein